MVGVGHYLHKHRQGGADNRGLIFRVYLEWSVFHMTRDVSKGHGCSRLKNLNANC